jgi:hypothetical protein
VREAEDSGRTAEVNHGVHRIPSDEVCGAFPFENKITYHVLWQCFQWQRLLAFTNGYIRLRKSRTGTDYNSSFDLSKTRFDAERQRSEKLSWEFSTPKCPSGQRHTVAY